MNPTAAEHRVFISYSHKDTEYVSPIVSLIGASRKDLVFQDYKSIQPGKIWREELEKALEQSKVVYVFWCKHAAASEEVKKEYTAAISGKKNVIPVLLDHTSLNEQLSAYQYVDLREVVSHKKSFTWQLVFKIVALPQLLLGVLVLVTYDNHQGDSEWNTAADSTVTPHTGMLESPNGQPLRQEQKPNGFVTPMLVLLLSVSIVLLVFGIRRITRQKENMKAADTLLHDLDDKFRR